MINKQINLVAMDIRCIATALTCLQKWKKQKKQKHANTNKTCRCLYFSKQIIKNNVMDWFKAESKWQTG